MLIKKYKGGGTSSYHPRMLLKVLVYCYLNNIYSSRKMEADPKIKAKLEYAKKHWPSKLKQYKNRSRY